MPTKKLPEETPRFDAILADLEQVVSTLEQGDLPLEEALAAFERGVKLTRDGERILGEAEKRVDLLLRTKEGEPVLEPFADAAPGTSERNPQ